MINSSRLTGRRPASSTDTIECDNPALVVNPGAMPAGLPIPIRFLLGVRNKAPGGGISENIDRLTFRRGVSLCEQTLILSRRRKLPVVSRFKGFGRWRRS